MRIFLVLAFCLLFGKEMAIAQNLTHNNAFTGASWIGEGEQVTIADSLLFRDHPAPLFRKQFTLTRKVAKATLSISAAGYYIAFINGKPLINNILDPAWTNFSKRIFYSSYDVTSLLKTGRNAICTSLGNGFYNLLPLRMFGSRNLRDQLPTGLPRFIAQLRVEYTDGSQEEINSDSGWKTKAGPILRNNVYLGVVYDARKEITNWKQPEFNDSDWKNAFLVSNPGGKLQPAFFPEIGITNRIKPLKISQIEHGFMVDMGVNLTGLYQIRLKGTIGDTVVFRFGERLYENGSLNPMTTVAGQIKRKGSGGPGSPAIAWQTDTYIFGKERGVTFQPEFTFHTFRFMEIKGLKYTPALLDVEALEFHTRVENQNSFSCSSDLINSIQNISRQTFLNNLISVQSDCAAREKFGYGGDLNATSEAFISNFGMQSFYRKTIYDWVDAMQDSIFIDTAPYVGIKYCGISWESAFLITQNKSFEYYGDTSIVNELYESDLRWMDKVRRLHPDEIIDKGLSDHESMVKVPVQLIGSTHYLDCARIMQRFAKLRNDLPNLERFKVLEQNLTRKILNQFWYKPVADPINRQTLFATLIYYKIIPPKDLSAAVDSLLKAIRLAPSGHFTTGIFGTKYILEALTMTGHADQAYQIVNSTAFPGWGFMVDRGATTLWETWKESDNTYSNCHPMFGSVSEWFYRWLAGIRPFAEHPGFTEFLLSPVFPGGLNQVKATYQAPTGTIKIEWKRANDNKILITISVPPGSSATFSPILNEPKIWKVTNVNTNSTVINEALNHEIKLRSGNYSIREQ
ncbi:MAG: family 78 glycoside hydrolase catalytic domain [Prolixibacteraceae bacterium]